ncbi:MAG TPA: molybdopterin cofactor-binding domain-containing protein [Gemmatimonadales bacterium]|nr:molybdopterin cofactor-binding domain-containing protein [Gemmatimonadales bacterium]
MTSTFTRRDFVKAGAATSGLVLALQIPAYARTAVEAMARRSATLSPSALLQVAPDGAVTLWLTKSEMGQGIHSTLAMIVAEELEVPLDAVRMQQAGADSKYGYQFTAGSSGISDLWGPLRLACAQAREMLLGAAARTWGVPASECVADQGVVRHVASTRELPFAALVATAAALKVPAEPPLKAPKAYRLLGRNAHRVDTASKVNGSARYGLDVRLPGMAFACVARCPVFGRSLTGFDADRARAVPGVVDVVPLESGEIMVDGFWRFVLPGAVAVVAENSWAAMRGCNALDCHWDQDGGMSSEQLARIFRDRSAQAGVLGRNDGDAPAALERAAKVVELAYEVPFLAHATMEPMNCSADVRAGRCDVYAPTQAPTLVRQVAETLTGFDESAITVHTTLMGGGFGRRGEMDWVIDSIRVSKALGRPVQVVWTREHDMQHDNYRPASYHVLRGGLDASGRITAWTHRVVAPSIIGWHAPVALPASSGAAAGEALDGAADLAYAIPHLRVDYCPVTTPVPVGWWRSVFASQNCFANETFLDELARAGGRDPLELRRELLADSPRHLAVLNLVAEKAGWGTPLPAGRGRGVAIHKFFSDAIVAEVAEVTVREGAIRVDRVVCAVDCGLAVNPDAVRAQMEGGIVYALSAALKGAITLEGGRVKQSNFHDYGVLRMSEMPRVEVHIVESLETPRGVGEPAVPPLAPAVANAVTMATGRAIRRLPIQSA